jgi:hypothetical protein
MQAFFVKAKVFNPILYANIKNHTVNSPSLTPILRSSAPAYRPDYMMEITAGQNGQDISKALLIYHNTASNAYNPEEDSYSLFANNTQEPVIVYTRSSDLQALDINVIGNLSQNVALGVRTSMKGSIRLKFSGIEYFKNKTDVYLIDSKLNKAIDLSLQNVYDFDKTEDEIFLDNRFFIRFGSQTRLNEIAAADVLITQPKARTIRIVSNDGNPLKNLQIMDIQGRLLVSEKETPGYTYQAKAQGVYLVRVGSIVKKVVVK